MASTLNPQLGPAAADHAYARLADTIERHGFLVVLAPLRRLVPVRRALLARLQLSEVDVTAILLAQLRGLGFPREAIVAAEQRLARRP